MRSIVKPLARVLICIGAVVAISAPLLALQTKPVTAGFILLIAVLIVSAAWGLSYALLVSFSAALAISKSIVESHRGRLWAEPNAGPGTTFHFTLPSED